MSDPNKQLILPLLPLRDVVVFPHMVIPLFVGTSRICHGTGSGDGAG